MLTPDITVMPDAPSMDPADSKPFATPPAAAPARARTPRHRLRVVLLAALVALLAAGAYVGWSVWFGAPDESSRYQYATVARGDIEELVSATGTLQPRNYVDVGAQVSGQLRKFHVEVGSEVKAGELLAEIDPVVLQSRVDATRAQLRNQRALLLERESSVTLAELQFRRQQRLMAEDATTAEALQNAEAALNSARAQIEALRAQIDQTESNLRADEANLNYARIYAPIAGTVVSITARQGQTLNTNQQAPVILRIADLSTMTVETQVSEADVSRLRLGMDVYFTTLGNQVQRWQGTLRKIEPTPTVQNNVVLYNALFDVPNPNRSLMTQMTAQVFFVVAAAHDALLIPMSALTTTPAGGSAHAPGAANGADGRRRTGAAAPRGDGATRAATVRVATPDGALHERPVEIGISNRIEAQVVSGLAEGERVVAGAALRSTAPATGARRMPRL